MRQNYGPLGCLMLLMCVCVLTGCTAPRETSQAVTPQGVAVKHTAYSGERYRVAIGKFENRSPYMTGIFADKDSADKLGMQAQQNLATHIAQSNRFMVVDRLNMAEMAREAQISGQSQALTGAQLLLTGAVTEFGRRETGTVGLGGIVGRSRTQTAYAKVSVNVVDVRTSQIVYAVQGAGEFELTNEHILGFGTEAGFDATLTDRVLNLAMVEVVNRLVEGLESKKWTPSE